MPTYPEVLTSITDDKAQFELCEHLVQQTLWLENGIQLLKEQPAFDSESKSRAKVFEQQHAQLRELKGGEEEAGSKRLRESTKTETRLIARAGEQEILLSGASISLALYKHRLTDELWVGKSDVLDGAKLSHLAALKERVANDIYAYYGVSTPRLSIAVLTCCYRTADNQRIYVEEEGVTQASHVMSRWLDRFNSYPAMPDFSPDKVADHYKLLIDDQLIPEKGLGRVLAVAHFIHDVDVANAHGKNLGYRLRVDEQSRLFAQTCKIDSGYAFHDADDLSSTAYRVTQSMPFKTQHRERDYVPFAAFPQATQAEFIAAVVDIINTPVTDLTKFFNRDGAELLKEGEFNTRALRMLTCRQAGLKAAFAEEVARQSQLLDQSKLKESKKREKERQFLSAELQPLYARHLLETNSSLFQQAQYFYLEPEVTRDHYKESKQQAFREVLADFLKDTDARVLLLLGDSGFGKSTATQYVAQQQWRDYLKEEKHARIAIRIELKQFTARTVKRCVENTLRDEYHLGTTQIEALKQQRCLILLDGFDEIGDQFKCNLWDSNQLGDWRDLRLIVTCRNVYLDLTDRPCYFYPASQEKGLQEWYLAPFNSQQIEDYLTRSLQPMPAQETTMQSSLLSLGIESKKELEKPSSVVDSEFIYSAKQLARSAQLQELLQVPLMLKIFSDAFPTLQKESKNPTQVNRYTLYTAFMQQWFERSRARLSQNLGKPLSSKQCQAFIRYSQDLAFELFKAERVQVDYAPHVEPWEQFFSQSDATTVHLRSGCPLRRAGNQYSFIHKSFYEFFLAQRILQIAAEESEELTPLIEVLHIRALTLEPQILLFLKQAHYAQLLPKTAQNKLLAVIRHSAVAHEIAQASANAATILNTCQINLSYQNWRGVQLPGADLHYGLLAHSDLREANLQGATLTQTILYQSNLAGADLRHVRWGEWPRLEPKSGLKVMIYHPMHSWLAISQGNQIELMDTLSGSQVGKPFIVPEGVGEINSTGVSAEVISIVFSPDGRRMVSINLYNFKVNKVKKVFLWEVDTQELLKELLKGRIDNSKIVCLSQDARLIAYIDQYNRIYLWDVLTQRSVGKPFFTKYTNATRMSLSPNGKLLVIEQSGEIELWDVATQNLLDQDRLDYRVEYFAFTPDGSIIFNDGFFLCRYDIYKKELFAPEPEIYDDGIHSIAVHPNGRQFATGYRNCVVRLWDAISLKPLGYPLIGHRDYVRHIIFSPDGRQLATNSIIQHAICLWDMTSQALLKEIIPKSTDIKYIVISSDWQWIVYVPCFESVFLWNIEIGLLNKLPWEFGYECVRLSPDNRLLTSVRNDDGSCTKGLKGSLTLWEVSTSKLQGPFFYEDQIKDLSFSSNSKMLAGCSEKTIYLWNATNLKVLKEFPNEYEIETLSFSPNTRVLVGNSGRMYNRDSVIYLWDVDSLKLLNKLSAQSGGCFGPNERIFVSVGDDGHLWLWDNVTSQKPLGKPLNEEKQGGLKFSPNGRILAYTNETGLCLWNLNTRTLLGKPLNVRVHAAEYIEFSPDGQRIAYISHDMHGVARWEVHVWDVSSGQRLGIIPWRQYANCIQVNSLSILAGPVKAILPLLSGSDSKSLSQTSAGEDWLAIGDTSGMISFWAVSRSRGATIRFLGMLRHYAVPLIVKGTLLEGCRIDMLGKRLLAQYGADVSKVLLDGEVTESKVTLSKEKEGEEKYFHQDTSIPVTKKIISLPLAEIKQQAQEAQTVETRCSFSTSPTFNFIPSSSSVSSSSSSTASTLPATISKGQSLVTHSATLFHQPVASTSRRPQITSGRSSFSTTASVPVKMPSLPPKTAPDAKTQELLDEVSLLIDDVYPPFNSMHKELRGKYLKQMADYYSRATMLTFQDRHNLGDLRGDLLKLKKKSEEQTHSSQCILC